MDSSAFSSFEEAERICEKENSTLISIESEQEQKFLVDYLFNFRKVVDSVWLGAKRTIVQNNSVFKWIDDYEFSYTNWEAGHPTNQIGRDCVQMNSQFDLYQQKSSLDIVQNDFAGKWLDVPCQKKNLVVCQIIPTWSISTIQRTLLLERKELKKVKKQLVEQQSIIDRFEKSSIPINFTYFQLPNQLEPKSLWPNIDWEDVSSKYTGLFIRVEGGNSAEFGIIQEENAPRVTEVSANWSSAHDYNCKVTLIKGEWSQKLYTGGVSGDNTVIQLYTTSGEVRPRNMAIRIWRRTK